MLIPTLTALRPQQWIKNLFVFLPLIFSGQFENLILFKLIILVFIIFSAAASAVYLINDVIDAPADRKHPTKKFRPIAAKQVPTSTALTVAVSLIFVSLAGAYLLSFILAGIMLVYFCLQLLYSFGLKHVAILDFILIALGFNLRVYAGAVVIAVTVSPWLTVLTFLVALLLATGKRLQELMVVSSAKTRQVLADYQPEFLERVIQLLLPTIFVSYLLYTFQSGQSPYLIASTLPVAYGLLRYLQILHDKKIKVDGPTELLFTDRPLQLALTTWGLVIFFVLAYL